MILRHRLHCIIVRAKNREQGAEPSGPPRRASMAAHWEDGHCSSEKVCWLWWREGTTPSSEKVCWLWWREGSDPLRRCVGCGGGRAVLL